MEQKITVGNVCFIKDAANDKILLLKRKKEPMSNMYTGVGGKTHFAEDVFSSCVREVKEETGLDITDAKLKAVVKTILDGYDSSWILFVYTTENFNGEVTGCEEGDLVWAPLSDVYSYELIGFIRKIMPHILEDNCFIEGLIVHDIKGNVLQEKIIRLK